MREIRAGAGSTPTRLSLIEAVRDWRNEESWQQFHETYARLIRGAARSQGLTESEAEDVVQETLLTLARTMPDFHYDPARCSFKTWLLHVTRNRIVDYVRRRGRRPRLHQSLSAGESRTATVERLPDPGGGGFEEAWEREWTMTLTEAALQVLKRQVEPLPFQIFYLNCIKGQKPQTVARALGVSTGRVYLVKHRLKPIFQRAVEGLREDWG